MASSQALFPLFLFFLKSSRGAPVETTVGIAFGPAKQIKCMGVEHPSSGAATRMDGAQRSSPAWGNSPDTGAERASRRWRGFGAP
eukprot:scaffold846_cov252-Pinguiococcus_pyrenoidosus.AAC.37